MNSEVKKQNSRKKSLLFFYVSFFYFSHYCYFFSFFLHHLKRFQSSNLYALSLHILCKLFFGNSTEINQVLIIYFLAQKTYFQFLSIHIFVQNTINCKSTYLPPNHQISHLCIFVTKLNIFVYFITKYTINLFSNNIGFFFGFFYLSAHKCFM